MKAEKVSSESVEATEDKVEEGYEEGSKVLIEADQMPPVKDVQELDGLLKGENSCLEENSSATAHICGI